LDANDIRPDSKKAGYRISDTSWISSISLIASKKLIVLNELIRELTALIYYVIKSQIF